MHSVAKDVFRGDEVFNALGGAWDLPPRRQRHQLRPTVGGSKLTCLQWLFAKTKRLCFLEMGCSAEPQYKEKLKANIDRAWVRRIMEDKGGFSEIQMFDAKEQG